ncbi:MAG: hypothetical protein AAF125_27190, partial [Chloroflexota bacterium]
MRYRLLRPRWMKVVRDLWGNKSRTILVVLSISVGVIAFGGLYAARDALLNNLNTQFDASNHHDIEIILSDSALTGFTDEIVRWAARRDGVLQAQGVAQHSNTIFVNGEPFDAAIKGYGDIENIEINRIVPEAGMFPPGRDEMVIERSFLPVLGVEVGDVIRIEGEDERFYEFELVG